MWSGDHFHNIKFADPSLPTVTHKGSACELYFNIGSNFSETGATNFCNVSAERVTFTSPTQHILEQYIITEVHNYIIRGQRKFHHLQLNHPKPTK